MIILGKTPDRMKGSGINETPIDEGILKQFFLGKVSGQDNVELDVDDGGYVFDTNNKSKFVPNGITKDKVKEMDTESFINNAKFYTCSENGQTYLCFRCVDSCVTCNLCHSACNGCQVCNAACHSCNGCNSCVGCDACHSYVDGTGY